jgi:integrase/recombinase XerD
MTPLRQAMADYLSVRRALGFRLDRAEKLLGQFLSYLEEHQAATVTTEHALTWATAPGGAAWWHALRLSAIRPFAAWLHALDPAAEVPPAGLIAAGSHRATPYLYSGAEITALMTAATRLPRQISAVTYPALIGALAATGMRIGEALALQISDFDQDAGILTIRRGKFGKARLLPLHPTTTAALGEYLRDRGQLQPGPASGHLFTSATGTRLDYNRVHRTYRRLTRQAGLTARSAACRPRLHDLRHSFAVASLNRRSCIGCNIPRKA